MTFGQIIIVVFLCIGWVLAYEFWRSLKEIRKTLIKLSILEGVDCSERCTPKEYIDALNELLEEVRKLRKESSFEKPSL